MAPFTRDEESSLNYAKQINYWRRNLKTFLPNLYTSNDSNRMTFAHFILSSCDVLGDLDTALTPEDRQGYIEWVYHCQLPEGGFRSFPGTKFGDDVRTKDNAMWDPANIPGTFFALTILILLKDDLSRVKRRETLQWLKKMQRPDGSFGELLGENDVVEGGNDSRFGYMGTGIRWILRGNVEGPVDGVSDIDVDSFVQCVQLAQTYDGGISEAPYQETHAGYAGCAIMALAFVDRLPPESGSHGEQGRKPTGLTNLPLTLHWLASRQTLTIDEDDALDTLNDETDSAATCHDAHSFVKLGSHPSTRGQLSYDDKASSHFELQWVGMNGRCNKIGDTCYAYWSCAPLALLGHLDIIDPKPIRKWLLDRTQHMIGGFGKLPDYPPDVYHSFLGLMTLAIFGTEAGLKDVDILLNMSNQAKEHLLSLPWRKAIVGN